MNVGVTNARRKLAELVRRAEAGEEVILARRGRPVARLVPIIPRVSAERRRAVIERVQASAAAQHRPGPPAARSQDFLYGDDGLPA